jgi:hypothetical protein
MIKSINYKLKSIYHHFKWKYFLYVSWKNRINDVLNSEDNKYIPRINNAGCIQKGYQVMHNGIKVKKNGYYGNGITKMLRKNKGVHEPQEERVFAYILDKMPRGATMIELGAYWSFYSMWFLKQVEGSQTYLIEPDKDNLAIGKLNYEANGFHGDFNNALISDKVNLDTVPPTLSIDYIVNDKKIDFIDILHSDIQGFELHMLNGTIQTIEQNKIGYFVISTHSNDIHYLCLDFLRTNNFMIICEADLFNTYSYDGLIVARSIYYAGIDPVEISKKTKGVNK